MSESRDRSLVANAADPEQVASGQSREKRRQLNEQADVRFLVDSPQGRRFIGRLLAHTGALPLRSVYAGVDAQTNYNAGVQDVGHWMLAELALAKPTAVTEVLTEILKETE